MTAHFDSKTETIQTGLQNIQGSLNSLCEQISELEQRVSSNEDNVDDLTKRVQTLEKENAYLKDKVEDAENRNRSSNLRFIGVPEKSEGRDMIVFMNKMIPLLLGCENFSTMPVIERAHRTPIFGSNARSAPRPILVKFLHFQDKVKILRLARAKEVLTYSGTRIHIYPDFSAGLVKKRREFDAVKKILRAADIKYSLLYPCTLRVTVDGKPKLFRCPEEADLFVKTLPSSPLI
uniref:L1 transposable element RRM domain-containing protein n=1 Tax=Astyanax mexicanus TaxID=7994 RepID=A0A3B1JM17_ASTMX